MTQYNFNNITMIATTTNSIENTTIIKYHGLVYTNVILGVNIFSDFSASVNDLFGGRSESYQRKLQTIYTDAIYELKKKAKRLRANAILGIKIDFDEISGKGKSMFMVSVVGTAASIEYHKTMESMDNEEEIIGYELLDLEHQKYLLFKKVQSKELLTKTDWEFILSNNIPQIADSLLKQFFNVWNETFIPEDIELKNNIIAYFGTLDVDFCSNLIYDNFTENTGARIKLIEIYRLFDAKRILEIFKQGDINNTTMEVLKTYKEVYTTEDITLMHKIDALLDLLPNKGRIEEVKGGLLSKGGEKYICGNGHKNDIDRQYCSQCAENIKGFTQDQQNIMNVYKIKLELLESLIKKNLND